MPLDPLWQVLNAAVHVIAGLGPHDHMTEQMKEFHWLPNINFKLCLMMLTAVTDQCPHCIRDIIYPLSTLPGHNRLQGAVSGQCDIRRTRTVLEKELFLWLVHASGALFHTTKHYRHHKLRSF